MSSEKTNPVPQPVVKPGPWTTARRAPEVLPPPVPAPVPMAAPAPLADPAPLEPRSFQELDHLADTLMRGGLAAGKGLPQVKCAILASIALKIPPIIGIQELYVTPQGKWEAETRLLLALAQRSPDWGGYTVAFSGEGPTRTCTVTMKRKGCPDTVQDMDLARATAWGWLTPKVARDGRDVNVWNKDADHMLETRCVAWALRKAFAAETLGLYSQGEISQQDKE